MKEYIASVLLFVMIPVFAQDYCIPTYTTGSTSGDYINSVIIENAAGDLVLDNSGSGALPNPFYEIYNNTSAAFARNATYTIRIENGTYPSDYFIAWIDYDTNGIFEDNEEKLGEFRSTVASSWNNIVFTVPENVNLINTRLRIRCRYSGNDPCTSTTFGETEDYPVYISQFERQSHSINPLKFGDFDMGDFDNDDDLDIILTGYADGGGNNTKIYENLGDGTFADYGITLAGGLYMAIEWGDYDNDNDLDFAICGSSGSKTTTIYNNNAGVFTPIGSNIIGVNRGDVTWADYDNDGDLDLTVIGAIDNEDPVTKIYVNEGADIFEDTEINLKGIKNGSAKWADYDNDQDLDLLLFGRDISGNRNTIIYRNEGNDIFTDIREDFLKSSGGQAIWADHDTDGDLDIFFSGWSYTEVYENNSNNFLPTIDNIPSDYYSTATDWADINSDGYPDIFIAGEHNGIAQYYAEIYIKSNDSYVKYDSLTNALGQGTAIFCDIDNNKTLDLIVGGGLDGDSDAVFNIYTNKTNNLNQAPSTPQNLSAQQLGNGTILSWSPSSDDNTNSKGLNYNVFIGTSPGAIDILSPMADIATGKRKISSIHGNAGNDTILHIKGLIPGTTYYWGVQAIDNGKAASPFSSLGSFQVLEPFTDILASTTRNTDGSVEWGDYDNDKDLDLLITGCSGYNNTTHKCTTQVARLYRNEGGDVFTEVANFGGGVFNGNAVWGDFDNDNNLDFAMSGKQHRLATNSDTLITKIYKNNGNGTFDSISTPIIGVERGNLSWNDFNNDGLLDLLLTGQNGSSSIGRLILNEGNGNFSINSLNFYAGWPNYSSSTDLNNDGLVDIVLASNSSGVYINNGDSTFTLDYSLPRSFEGSLSFSDFDNDDDLDFVMCGEDEGDYKYTYIYENNDGQFEELDLGMRGIYNSSVEFGDYNNDGYPDVLMCGYSGKYLTAIYVNNGAELLTFEDLGLTNINNGDASWGDYDNDGDLDVAISGLNGSDHSSKIFRNNGNWKQTVTTSPINTEYSLQGYDLVLRWDKISNSGYTYNVKLDSVPFGNSIVSSMSDSSGFRKTTCIGNAGTNDFYLIKDLDPGKYYWNVQAIDQSNHGGPWSALDSVIITDVSPSFSFEMVCQGVPTGFHDLSETTDSITNWKWNFGDGASSTLQNPEHLYQKADTFEVTLWTYTFSGDSGSIKHDVIVMPSPAANFSALPVCHKSKSVFTDNSITSNNTITKYTWYFGDNDKTDLVIGDVEHTYLNSGQYTAALSIKALNGCTDSIAKTVVVAENPQAAITLAEGYNSTICEGENTLIKSFFTDDNFNYRWRRNGVFISDYTEDSLIIYQDEGFYSIYVSNSIPSASLVCSNESDSINIIINKTPEASYINATDDTLTICDGDSAFLDIPYNAAYRYDWIFNNNHSYLNNNEIYARSEGLYKAEVTDTSNNCFSLSTDSVFIEILPSPTGFSINYSTLEICEGDSTFLRVDFFPEHKYQWYKGDNKLTEDTLYQYTVSDSGKYSAVITNTFDCSAQTSNTRTITLKPKPDSPTIESVGSTNICEGDTATIFMNGTATEYNWLRHKTKTSFNTPLIKVISEGKFSLTVIEDNCESDTSNIISVVVNPIPDKPIIRSNAINYCEGDTAKLNIIDPLEGLTYQWFNGIIPENSTNPQILSTTNSGSYFVKASSEFDCSSESNIIDIDLLEYPPKPIISELSGQLCPFDSITLEVVNYHSKYNYQWQRNGQDIERETNSELYRILDEADYSVEVTNEACEANSNVTTINFDSDLERPLITVFGPNVWYMGVNNNTAAGYRWYLNGEPLAGENRHMLLADQNLGTYYASITDGSGCWVNSDTVEIPTDKYKSAGEIAVPTRIAVYPNPSDGIFNLELFSSYRGVIILEVTDMKGDRILSKTIQKENIQHVQEINLNTPPGFYLIRINSDGYIETRALVIE